MTVSVSADVDTMLRSANAAAIRTNIGCGTAAAAATGDFVAAGTACIKASNLSDVAAIATARANLGVDKLGSMVDANKTLAATDKMIVTTVAFTLPRTVTLPAASAVNAGYEIIIADALGTVTGTNTLTISRDGSDTIDGATTEVIGSAYGMRRLFSDGVSKWSFDKGLLLVSNNLSDVAVAATARTNLGLGSAATHASTDFDASGAAAGIIADVHPNNGFDIPGASGESATNRASVTSDCTFSFILATRVFTVSPTGSTFRIWRNGAPVDLAAKTVTLPDMTGVYYITVKSDGTLQASTAVWSVFHDICVSIVYYYHVASTILGFATDERHGAQRNVSWHYHTHTTIGARWQSGGVGTFTNTTLSVTNVTIVDEDIVFASGGTITTCKLWWYDGAQMVFSDSNAAPYYAVAGVLKYDNAGTLTSVPTNNYVINDVYATTDPANPIWVRVGSTVYNSLANAQAALGTTSSMNNIPTNEMKLLYQVMYKQVGPSTPTFQQSTDYRNSSSIPGSSVFTVPAHANTHAAAGTDPVTLAAIGAAASGANSDITSLASLSTALSVGQGGTGGTTAAAAATNLNLGVPSAESGNRALAAADNKKVLQCTGTLTFTVNTGLPSGFSCVLHTVTGTVETTGTATVTDERVTGFSAPFTAGLIQTAADTYSLIGAKP